MHITDRPDVGEFNGLVDGSKYHAERHAQGHIETVSWSARGLRITRLRLLSDPGFPAWDISYCHGMLDGLHVDVEFPFSQLPKRNFRKYIVDVAKKHKVYIKGTGIFDTGVISTLN